MGERGGGAVKLYKVTNVTGTPCNGGSGQWHLPSANRPGKWMPRISNIKPCVRGYHVCRIGQLLRWLGPAIWEVEIRGDKVVLDDKIVGREQVATLQAMGLVLGDLLKSERRGTDGLA